MYAIVGYMAGQRSVRERPLPSAYASRRWLGVLVTLMTVFGPIVPHAAAAHTDLAHLPSVRPGAATAIRGQNGASAAAGRSVERWAAAVAAPEDDDAGEGPRDDQTMRNEPAMPALAARAVPPEECPDGAPAPVGSADRAHAEGTPPTSVFRCNPDGRGPPKRP